MIKQSIKIVINDFYKLLENLNYLDKQNILDWEYLSENISSDIDINLFIEVYKEKINWEGLSRNTTIKWDANLIEKYKVNLDFKLLSNNKSIPFTDDLILKHIDKWDWNVKTSYGRKYGWTTLSGLCFNPNFPISVDFIEKVQDYIDWRSLGMNKELHIFNPSVYGDIDYCPIDPDDMEENFEVIFRFWDKWCFKGSSWYDDNACCSGTSRDSIKDNKSIDWEFYEKLRFDKTQEK